MDWNLGPYSPYDEFYEMGHDIWDDICGDDYDTRDEACDVDYDKCDVVVVMRCGMDIYMHIFIPDVPYVWFVGDMSSYVI